VHLLILGYSSIVRRRVLPAARIWGAAEARFARLRGVVVAQPGDAGAAVGRNRCLHQGGFASG